MLIIQKAHRDASEIPGPFQVSFILYEGGKVPNPSYESLIELAKKTCETISSGEVVETSSGNCRFGVFSTAVFRSIEYPRTQAWALSNGHDFILATHICPSNPEPREVTETQQIVMELTIEEKPLWKFCYNKLKSGLMSLLKVL